ncbi:MAG: hypothetical protein ABEJ25_03160 [Candidatus Bipolaricaulia bacterium]
MIPSLKVINAFRSVADTVENSEPNSDWGWNFKSPRKCNCGLLAQELGISEEDIDRAVLGHWTNNYRNHIRCDATGLSEDVVFQTLKYYGFGLGDVEEIETVGRTIDVLPDGAINSRPVSDFEEYRQTVADYFRAKADELEQRLQTLEQSAKPAEEETVPVSVN